MSYEPVANVSVAIKGYFDLIHSFLPDITPVFVPQLDFQDTLRIRRSLNNAESKVEKVDFPILAWNRSAVRINENLREHAGRSVARNKKNVDTFNLFSSIAGEFDFNYVLLTNTIRDLEVYELVLTVLAFNAHQFNIDLGELGDNWPFQVDWDYLDTLDINLKNNFYLGLKGSAKITGSFLIATEEYPVLHQIVATAYTYLYEESIEINY